MISYSEVERLLQTYSLEDLLELNGLTEEDALYCLIEQEMVEIPDPKPMDLCHE